MDWIHLAILGAPGYKNMSVQIFQSLLTFLILQFFPLFQNVTFIDLSKPEFITKHLQNNRHCNQKNS